jgi:hypothetical protein
VFEKVRIVSFPTSGFPPEAEVGRRKKEEGRTEAVVVENKEQANIQRILSKPCITRQQSRDR